MYTIRIQTHFFLLVKSPASAVAASPRLPRQQFSLRIPRIKLHGIFGRDFTNQNWMVVLTILKILVNWKDYLIHYGKYKMFQTTNQKTCSA